VGKTRLALRIAEEARSAFPDGVVFVPLAPLHDASEVAGVLADALGVHEASEATRLQHLTAVLHGRRLLLVLDNFEQVVDAAPELVELLLHCPALKVLVTSRAPLRVSGEHEYRVPPLDVPDSAEESDVDALWRSPAVRLFVIRAQTAIAGFELTTANATAISAICRRLDGLPLALELAASRVKFLPPHALLERLGRGLSVLAGGPRDVPARQQTMRAAVAWSYDLLDDADRRLFRRMAVFAGGGTLDAIEAVCAEPGGSSDPELGGIVALLDSSLLVRETSADTGADVRYRMLEPIRDFARERLDASGELHDAQRRHADYYRALAASGGPHLTRPDQMLWLKRLVADEFNLRAAVRAILDSADNVTAIELLWTLWRFWRIRGQLRRARAWAVRALADSGEALPLLHHGRALLLVGMAWSERDLPTSRAALEEGLVYCRQAGDIRGQALACLMLGLMATSERDGTQARLWLEESLRLSRTAGEVWAVAFAATHLGVLPLLRGEYAEAGRWFEEGLAAARASGDRVSVHQALYYLGLLALRQDGADRAAEHFGAGLAIAGELEDRLNAGYFLKGLAEVAERCGLSLEAARLLGADEAIREATGAPRLGYTLEQTWYERTLANARAALGDAAFEEAWTQGRSWSFESAVSAALAITEACAARSIHTVSAVTVPGGEILTARELEVLRLMAAGLSNTAIAERLYIGVGTVKTHVNHIFSKLAVASRTQAVARAHALNLLANEHALRRPG
jgi:non-specific serine/threonine protein kinase